VQQTQLKYIEQIQNLQWTTSERQPVAISLGMKLNFGVSQFGRNASQFFRYIAIRVLKEQCNKQNDFLRLSVVLKTMHLCLLSITPNHETETCDEVKNSTNVHTFLLQCICGC